MSRQRQKQGPENIIRFLKEREKLTVQQIADRFGYCHSHIWKMLHGYRPVSKRILAALMEK